MHEIPKCQVECQVCKLRLTKRSLEKHMATHGEREIFSCPDCPKTFFYQSTLDAHHRSIHEHLEVLKKFLCNQCGAAKKSKSSLDRHLKSHLDVRPYACDQCNKTYKLPEALKTHIQNTHLNIRPHVCCECGSGFFRRSLLSNHQRTHTGEKPFVCDICHQTFSFQAGLYLHRQNNHAS